VRWAARGGVQASLVPSREGRGGWARTGYNDGLIIPSHRFRRFDICGGASGPLTLIGQVDSSLTRECNH
jgi:hypothetical protein